MLRRGACLNAVWNSENNRIIEDPAEVAYVVTEYWQKVFNESPINETLMKKWLRNFDSDLNASPEQLTPTLRQVHAVILASGPSSPGPDGLAFEGYKAIATTASIVHPVPASTTQSPQSLIE